MKAIVQDRYGPPDLLRLSDVARPAADDDEVLVRVRAASLHPNVWHVVTVRSRPAAERPRQPAGTC
jgi:NADPH:quinone reductase-like Zn-dependent oxidoreductase